MPDPKPKARRRRKEARPAEIVAAGMAEFSDKGFAAARLDDIARRAGVVKGTLYLYFESKEDLFKEAVRAQVLPSITNIEGMVDAFDGPTDVLIEAMIRQLYGLISQDGPRAIIRILISEGVRFPDIIDFYYAEVVSVGERMMLKILRRGVERGELRDSPALQAPMVVVGPAIAAAVWRMTFERAKPLDIDAFCKAHLDVVLNGLHVRRN